MINILYICFNIVNHNRHCFVLFNPFPVNYLNIVDTRHVSKEPGCHLTAEHWTLNHVTHPRCVSSGCGKQPLSLPQVLLWDVSQGGAVLRYPVRVVLMPVHHRCPSDALLLSVSFNSDGSRLAVTSKDRRVRVLDPRTGRILQVCF